MIKRKKDKINPLYYQRSKCTCGKELQTYDFLKDLPYTEASAIKYIVRHKQKNGKEDILKALWFINKLLEEYK